MHPYKMQMYIDKKKALSIDNTRKEMGKKQEEKKKKVVKKS